MPPLSTNEEVAAALASLQSAVTHLTQVKERIETLHSERYSGFATLMAHFQAEGLLTDTQVLKKGPFTLATHVLNQKMDAYSPQIQAMQREHDRAEAAMWAASAVLDQD